MRFLSALMSSILVLSILALAATLLVLTDDPALERMAEFTPEQIERAKRLLRRHDPRKATDESVRTLRLSEEELDLALNYLVSRFGPGSASASLDAEGLTLKASIALPQNPIGRFVNLEGHLREHKGALVPEGIRVGQVPLPDWMTAWLFARAQTYLSQREDYRIIADSVKSVSLSRTAVSVEYAWAADFPDRLRNAALSPEDRVRLKVYQVRLAELSRTAGAPRVVPLPDVLVPLMRLAAERSVEGGAHLENRALLIVLALHLGGRDIARFIPEARQWVRPARRKITLAGRADLAQHFVISAALTTLGGGPLADAIGVHKELGDARGGSGFSFKDFAANRAGTAFGRKASDAGGGASGLQQGVIAGITDADLLPNLAGLPEFMPFAEFARRYGDVGAPAYARTVQDIDQRVEALRLYR